MFKKIKLTKEILKIDGRKLNEKEVCKLEKTTFAGVTHYKVFNKFDILLAILNPSECTITARGLKVLNSKGVVLT